MIYQKDSSKAEEFIHHEEILDTLEYAQNNKDNRVLIEQLIEKAALFFSFDCQYRTYHYFDQDPGICG